MSVTYEPIGFLKSCFKEKFGTPRQPNIVPESTASLKIRGDLNPTESLKGLEGFSHVWILFHFHKNENKQFNAKIYPPRMAGEKTGVFATRSPHRANPIGLTCARIDRIEGDTIYFSGIDIVDDTPILDLKPYLPEVDSIGDAKAGWVDRAGGTSLRVQFSSNAEQDLKTLGAENIKTMITQILSQDPRNPMDRELSRQNKPLGFFLSDYNVIFSVEGTQAQVLRVESKQDFKRRQLT